MKVAYHEAAKTDYDEILIYLESISERVADQFEKEFQQTLTKAKTNPYHFPPLTNSSDKRRANIKRYNHHFIYEVNEIADEIRILIIKHDKRHPSHGLNRSWPQI